MSGGIPPDVKDGRASVRATSSASASGDVFQDPPRPEGLPHLNDLLVEDLKALNMTKHQLSRRVALSPQAVSAWGSRDYIPSQHIQKVLDALEELGPDGNIYQAAHNGVLKQMESYALELQRLRAELDTQARALRARSMAERLQSGIGSLAKGAFQAEKAAYRYLTQDADAKKRLDTRRALSAKWNEIVTQDYEGALDMLVNDYTGYEGHFNFDFYVMRSAKSSSDAVKALAASSTARLKARANARGGLADLDNVYPYDHWYNNGEVVAELYEIDMTPSHRFKDSENTKPGAVIRRQNFEKPLLNLVAAQRQPVLHFLGKGMLYVVNRSEAFELDDADTKKVTAFINRLQRDYFKYFQKEVEIMVVGSVKEAVHHIMTSVLQLEAAEEEALGYEIEQSEQSPFDEWGDEFDEALERFNDEMFQKAKESTRSES